MDAGAGGNGLQATLRAGAHPTLTGVVEDAYTTYQFGIPR